MSVSYTHLDVYKRQLFFLCLSLGTIKKHVQFANGVTSFLYMSDAEMQRDGTLMIGGGGKSEINGKPVENSTYLSK